MQLRRNSQQFSSDTYSKSSSYNFTAGTHTNHTFLRAANKEMEIQCSQLSSSTQTTINTFSKSQSRQGIRNHLCKIKTKKNKKKLQRQLNTYPVACLDKQNKLLMAERSQLSFCYKKLIISTDGYAMSQFTKESSGYIQIRTLVAHVQNSSGVAVYIAPPAIRLLLIKHIQAKHHYTRSLPQVSKLFQTTKCQDSTVELVKMLPTSPIYAYPMSLHTQGLDSLIQWFHLWGLQLRID